MEFNWTTFALEILNFLVLLWILKRFLYRPVKHVLTQRKAAIDASLDQARSMQATAEDLKRHYVGRMAEWEVERTRARVQLADEIAAERARLMADVHLSIELERNKDRAIEQRRTIELRQRINREAVGEAAGFAARLLTRLAGAALDKRIGEIAMEDLPTLPEESMPGLRQSFLQDTVRVTSAYLLPGDVRADLAAALTKLAGGPVACEFAVDTSLIAGLRIGAGPWLLRCNLADELAFFVTTSAVQTT